MKDHDPVTSTAAVSTHTLDVGAQKPDDDDALHRTVVVGAYASAAFASMVRARLEGEGIASHLVDEETMGIAPHLAIALGGVKVTVHESDGARAKEILREIEDGAFADDLPDDALGKSDDDTNGAPIGKRDADRALAAALVGAMFFPPAVLYSSFLVVRALRSGQKRARALFALVVDVGVIAMWSYLVVAVFRF